MSQNVLFRFIIARESLFFIFDDVLGKKQKKYKKIKKIK